MTYLLIGLVLFLGVHSVRIIADDWRNARVAALGVGPWKVAHALVSLAGLVLIVWGYEAARAAPVDLWQPASWARHLAGLLTLVAFLLMTAAYVPGSLLRSAVGGHPMVLAVMIWAFGHLLANGRLVDLLLFGGFLLWAVFAWISLRRRDRASGTTCERGSAVNDIVTVLVGVTLWYLFALHLHRILFGVPPFG